MVTTKSITLVQPLVAILAMLNSAKTVLLLWLLNVMLVLLELLSMEPFVNVIPASIRMEEFAQSALSNVCSAQLVPLVLLALIMSPETLLIIVTAELVTLIVEVQSVVSAATFVRLALTAQLAQLVSPKITDP